MSHHDDTTLVFSWGPDDYNSPTVQLTEYPISNFTVVAPIIWQLQMRSSEYQGRVEKIEATVLERP
jgi:hypothetical protein